MESRSSYLTCHGRKLTLWKHWSKHRAPYVIVTHCINTILQVTFSIVRQHDATQLAVSSEMKSSISGEDKQTRRLFSPTNEIL